MDGSEAAFDLEEYQRRRARVREHLAQHDLAALIVTAPEEIYYLAGLHNQGHFVFTALVMTADSERATLVARQMEGRTAAVQLADCDFAGYRDGEDPSAVIDEALAPVRAEKARTIGYQAGSLSFPVAIWRSLDQRLGSPAWVDCTDLLAEIQSIRTDAEIALLRRAARLSDVGMRAGIEASASEQCAGGEIVGAIQGAMLSAGSDYPGFVPLVRPLHQIGQEHVAWTPHAITEADTLFLELSAASARYHGPLARTVRPSRHGGTDTAAEVAAAGLEAICVALRPGRTAEQVYRDWKATIDEGLGRSYERHHCGYAVGIGFPPSWMAGRVDSLRPGSRLLLREGMTFHVQSWVIDERLGTHATSDTALVTATGGELLTTTPRTPVRLAGSLDT